MQQPIRTSNSEYFRRVTSADGDGECSTDVDIRETTPVDADGKYVAITFRTEEQAVTAVFDEEECQRISDLFDRV
jgi:hypothetical protein